MRSFSRRKNTLWGGGW